MLHVKHARHFGNNIRIPRETIPIYILVKMFILFNSAIHMAGDAP